MMKEAAVLTKIAKNIAVKVPLTWDGLKACAKLSGEGTMVNVTLCFSPVQAWMAAKAGATFISPFIGRVDDAGEDGMGLIHDIRAVYDNYGFKTEILAASIRSVSHVRECLLAGADVGTMPADIFKKLLSASPDRQGPGRLRRRRQEGQRHHQVDGLKGRTHFAKAGWRCWRMKSAPARTRCAPMAMTWRASSASRRRIPAAR